MDTLGITPVVSATGHGSYESKKGGKGLEEEGKHCYVRSYSLDFGVIQQHQKEKLLSFLCLVHKGDGAKAKKIVLHCYLKFAANKDKAKCWNWCNFPYFPSQINLCIKTL